MTRADRPGGRPPGLVFTDLDGTLLDHHTYDFSPARPALERLARSGVPVVLCSSKTRAEILELQEQLGIEGPFVPENGGAVLITGGGPLKGLFPGEWGGLPAKVFGTPYPELRRALGALRDRFGAGIRGFGDVDVEEVARWTGLPLPRARRAAERDFDEPFRWEPEPEPGEVEEVRRWLGGRGLHLTRGGRFWHLLGANDKGRAVGWLLEAARALWGERVPSVGLGDSENDVPMLKAVDRGVLVERPGGGFLEPVPPGVHTVPGAGPVGWSRAVEEWLASGLPGEP